MLGSGREMGPLLRAKVHFCAQPPEQLAEGMRQTRASGGPKLGRKMGAATWRASHGGRMRCSVLEYGVGGCSAG